MVSIPSHEPISLDCETFLFRLEVTPWVDTTYDVVATAQTASTDQMKPVSCQSGAGLTTHEDLRRLVEYLMQPSGEVFLTYALGYQLSVTPDAKDTWCAVEVWINCGSSTAGSRVWLGFTGECERAERTNFAAKLSSVLSS